MGKKRRTVLLSDRGEDCPQVGSGHPARRADKILFLLEKLGVRGFRTPGQPLGNRWGEATFTGPPTPGTLTLPLPKPWPP